VIFLKHNLERVLETAIDSCQALSFLSLYVFIRTIDEQNE